jgi:hypothetical protein
MEEGVRFFNEKLGFNVNEEIMLDDELTCTPVQLNNAELCIGLVEDKQNTGFKTRIVLATDDCLKDYHNLKLAGVSFEKQPRYLSNGLSAEFSDSYGNQYVLLEERNYNEL